MDLGTLFQQAPQATQGVALLALGGAIVILLYGAWHWRVWRREASALEAVGDDLVSRPDLQKKRHGALFDQADDIMAEIKESAKTAGGGSARRLIDELGAQIKLPHDPAVIGAGSSWPEVSRRYLGARRRPLRLMRAAAGWVVLLGLAGTVLGFIEALPQMREAFTNAAQAQAAAHRQQADLEPDGEQPRPGASAAGEMMEVLGDLGGVFLATLTGVLAALGLYIGAAGFERAFDRLAREVEVFGRRWFLPLVQPPYTQLDQAVRNQLGSYFQDLSSQFSGLMQPVVQGLVDTLGKQVEMSKDFAANIEQSQKTLKTFHNAVETLGTSAEKAVEQLAKIIEPSQQFLADIQRLQREGEEKFAATVGRLEEPLSNLATPMTTLAASAETVATEVRGIQGSTEALKASVGQVDETLAACREDVGDLRQHLGGFTAAVGEQGRAVANLAKAVGDVAAAQALLETFLGEMRQELLQIRTEITDLGSGLQPEAALPTAVSALLNRLDQGLDTGSDEVVAALGQLGDHLAILERELSEIRVEAEAGLRQVVTQITTTLETLGDRPAPSFEGVRQELVTSREQAVDGRRQLLDELTPLRELLAGGTARVRLAGTEDLEASVVELRAGVNELREVAQSLRPQVLRAAATPKGAKGKRRTTPAQAAVSEALLAEQIRVLERMEKLTSRALTRLEQQAARQEETLREIRQQMGGRRRAISSWLRRLLRRTKAPAAIDDREDLP